MRSKVVRLFNEVLKPGEGAEFGPPPFARKIDSVDLGGVDFGVGILPVGRAGEREFDASRLGMVQCKMTVVRNRDALLLIALDGGFLLISQSVMPRVFGLPPRTS